MLVAQRISRFPLALALCVAAMLAAPASSLSQGAGVDWWQATSAAAFSPRFNQSSIVFNPATGSGSDGSMWVLGGYNGSTNFQDVWYSSDGVGWTLATASAAFGVRANFSMAVYNGLMWVIAGHRGFALGDVWYSADGVNWTQATASAAFGARWNHRTVVYNGLMWVIGGYTGSGYLNDVWYSADGVNWTQATASAAFAPRELAQVVVYNGLMWVIGGGYYPGTALYNDVWYSADGVNWTLATASAGFSPRVGHAALVYDGLMWVIAGTNATSTFNDVWYSADGVDWTQATAAADFPVRDQFSSLVYNPSTGSALDGRMWVIGGETWNIGDVKADVWYSPVSLVAETPTPTDSATPTATATATPTQSPTPTETPTPTLTATASYTPTDLATPTPSATPTASPTASPTHTPSCQNDFFISRNLFRPLTDLPPLFIRIRLCAPGPCLLSVYNTAGEHVRKLRDRPDQPAGTDQIPWDGKNQFGEDVASGLYLVRFEDGNVVRWGKVVVLR